MKEYIEFGSIFRLEFEAENIVLEFMGIHFMHARVKFDFFILIEFCTSSIIFKEKLKDLKGRTLVYLIE